MGLTEVVFAVLFAWLALGELPTVVQAVGGVLIVAGIALVRLDAMRSADPADTVAAPDTAPDTAPELADQRR